MNDQIKGALAACVEATQMTADEPETLVFELLGILHEHLPETERPSGWSDFSDPQAERVRKAITHLTTSLTRLANALLTARADGWRAAIERAAGAFGCHAGRDGECNWSECPQNRDGEPAKSGRYCPRDIACGDPCCDAVEYAAAAVQALKDTPDA